MTSLGNEDIKESIFQSGNKTDLINFKLCFILYSGLYMVLRFGIYLMQFNFAFLAALHP